MSSSSGHFLQLRGNWGLSRAMLFLGLLWVLLEKALVGFVLGVQGARCPLPLPFSKRFDESDEVRILGAAQPGTQSA